MFSRQLNVKEAKGHAADNGTTQYEVAPTAEPILKGSTVRVFMVKARSKIP